MSYLHILLCSYRDDRDRHRQDDKNRLREKERREREYEPEKDRDRHERYERRSVERKKNRKSLSPYSQKSRGDLKDLSPERSTKKKEKDHEEKVEEKKKEKKIKEKKKKKDSDEKEKKKKKKKDKKSNQKEVAKDDPTIKAIETDDLLIESKTSNDTLSSPPNKTDSVKACNEEDSIQNRIECISNQVSIAPIKEEFEDKSLAMNPEPPEFNEPSPGSGRLDRAEFGTNPPNPNFKPIPELKSDMKPIDSLYGGLDDTEINTVITEKYSLLSEHSQTETKEAIIVLATEKSPKKDEFLAPIPELSKWERDDTIEKPEDDDDNDDASGSPTEKIQREDEPKSMKMVTSEVLKRAENAIFQKAINAIRPIEIKKISESRKILYQNPEPKVLETVEPANREPRKSVNVTINVGRNERNVEITEPAKKAKLDRTKFKPVPETAYSPTRLSAKERLGEKIEDGKEKKISPIKGFMERRDAKNENQSRSRSPRREKRISSPLLERRVESSSLGLTTTSGERKVFLEERKRDKDRGDRSKERSDFRGDRHGGELKPERESRIDCRTDFRSNRNDKGERLDKDRDKERDREHRGRTPPSACAFKRTEMSKISLLKSKDDEEEKRRDKKSREEKKRKKEHRSRSKSKEHKKRKEKKHKKDKDKNQEKKQKHKEAAVSKDKTDGNETKITYENIEPPLVESLKKQRKNPRLVSDRKRSILDEASFEPDYSASDSESDGEEGKPSSAKKLKLDETELDKEMEMKSLKKRSKSSSSEDTSSSSDTTSSDSDSSDDSHKKKRKKHKKHKKKKSAKKDSSSDSDTYSDSSDSSTDEEKHKKKSKKSKSRSKQSKKKKKSKHK